MPFSPSSSIRRSSWTDERKYLLVYDACALSFALQVCKRMDMICQRVLNQGFLKVERYHSLCQRQVKAQLPRFVVAQHKLQTRRRAHPT